MIKSAKLNGTNKTCMILKLSQIVLGFFHMRIITRLYKSCVYERERERERESQLRAESLGQSWGKWDYVNKKYMYYLLSLCDGSSLYPFFLSILSIPAVFFLDTVSSTFCLTFKTKLENKHCSLSLFNFILCSSLLGSPFLLSKRMKKSPDNNVSCGVWCFHQQQKKNVGFDHQIISTHTISTTPCVPSRIA